MRLRRPLLSTPCRRVPRFLLGVLAGIWLSFGGVDASLAAESAAPAGCVPPATPTWDEISKASQQPADRGFLWRIEKDGRTSWLYGTMHVGKPAWMYPGDQVRGALRQSDTVAVELDMNDPATLAVFTEPFDTAAAARMLTPERQRRLDRQAAAACLPSGALARLRPILQVSTLAGLAARYDGLFSEWGSEHFLSVYARSNAKPVVALESAQAQLRALAGDREADEIAQVDQTLDELESGQARVQGAELAAVWANSDWARLTHYRDWCDCVKTPVDERALQRLLDERNPGLADGIARRHAQGQRVFAAVGALHMVGPQGLPALLAARGFSVTRALPAP